MKTRNALSGLTLELRWLAARSIQASGIRYCCGRLLLLLSLCLTGFALAPAASAQASPPGAATYQQLKSFGSPSPGGAPQAGLIQGADGALYGTAGVGGTYDSGTVFKLNRDGTGFTVLKNFDYAYYTADGRYLSTTGGGLSADLIQGTDGALYGTASSGGSSGWGTVFKLNLDGTGFAVLQNFDRATTGASPFDRLMQGADGALYGTATVGGSGGGGTVFKLNPDGTGFTFLQNFGDDYNTTGASPLGLRLPQKKRRDKGSAIL